MSALRYVPAVAVLAATTLASGCGSSTDLPPCGTVTLTFSNVLNPVPDIGQGWSSRTESAGDTTSAVGVSFFSMANNNGSTRNFSLRVYLPGPLTVGQHDSVAVTYFAPGGAAWSTLDQQLNGGGTVRVESLSPTVKLTFVNDAMIPAGNVTGSFTINGTGEWTNGYSCNSLQ